MPIYLYATLLVALLAGWLSGSAYGATAPVALPPDVAEAVNMIANPSFEEGSDLCPVDWVFFNQCQQTAGHWISGQARSGVQCVSVEGSGGLAYGRWLTAYRLPLQARGRYHLGFWYKGRGGSVYLLGNECRLDVASGILTEAVNHTYQAVVVKTEPSDEWRYYAGDFVAPDYPSWARVCLAGGGRESCYFDEVSLVPDGLHLVQPREPILCETGAVVTAEFRMESGAGSDIPPTDWEVTTPGIRLIRAVADPLRKTWRLDLQATGVGFYDLAVRCRQGQAVHLLTRPNFLRAHAPLQGTFAFTVFTDAHLYRSGTNERNEAFGRFITTATALDPLFAIGLGDQMDISSGATDVQKKLIAEAVREQLARLHMPVYTVAGNHEIDKTSDGAGTRWYQEKYLGWPAYYGFAVGGLFFAGIDTTVAGIYGRDHGGGLIHPGQTEWLDAALRSAHERGLTTVMWTHIPLYGEFQSGPDRDRLLGLVYSNGVKVVLSGHIHDNLYLSTPNPVLAGHSVPPWPKPESLADGAVLAARLADPSSTVFLTSTTVSAFLLGNSRYNGFLYAWVRDGRIAWMDTVPLSLSVVVEHGAGSSQKIHIRNGPEKALKGFPLKLDIGPGRMTVSASGRDLPVVDSGAGGGCRWVQVDIPAGGEVTINVSPLPHP